MQLNLLLGRWLFGKFIDPFCDNPIATTHIAYTMGEPISLASGLLTLATFALQSSVTLYDTIKSFHSHLKRVYDLLEELEALSEVLGPLTEIVNTDTDSDPVTLKLPLLRCGNACKEFERELLKCSSRSSDRRTSFRD